MGLLNLATGRTRRVIAVTIVTLAALATTARGQDVGVFVSSETTDGSIDEPGFSTGIDSADAICNRLGTAAVPGSGPWVAWLSAGTQNAAARIPVPGASDQYVQTAFPSTVIATDLADLTDGTLTNPIAFDETGSTPATVVWTGTNTAGTLAGPNCSDWTSAGGFTFGRVGQSVDVGATWTSRPANFGCGGGRPPLGLYCFGHLSQPVPATPGPAMLTLLVFLLGGGATLLYRNRRAAG